MSNRPTSLQSDRAPAAAQLGAFRLGVLAFGDSITNAGGELQWGVAMQSWAMWVARALGVPYNPYAADGAIAADVIERQLPLVDRAADRYSHYTLGCLYIGTNDVRLPAFDVDQFEELHNQALGFLAERCDRVLTLTIPLDMGRPRNPTLIEQANRAIERSAAAHGALVLDLRRFGGRGVMMADHVHPTALGQVAIAKLALALLGADGLPTRIDVDELIDYEVTPWGQVRGDLTYAYRHLKQDLRLYIASRRAG